MASKRVGLISINLVAGTAQFNTDMANAKAKIVAVGGAAKEASGHMVSGMMASSAAIRVMEGGMTNNLRAVERFVSGTLGLGPALQKIFPVVGAIAFAGLIVKLGVEVYDFYKKVAEGPARIANAFRQMSAPIKLTNDELRVTNDRLTNDIAKLEGRRQNNLQLALDEARVTADHLADSLEKDLTALNKLLKDENISAFKGFFTNQASTTDLKEYMGGRTGTGGFFGDIAEINDRGKAKIDAAAGRKDKKAQDAAIIGLNTELEERYAKAISHVNFALETAQILQQERDKALQRTAHGLLNPGGVPRDQTSEIELARASLGVLRAGPQLVELTATKTALTGRKEADEAANANAKLDAPLDDKLAAIGTLLAESQERLEAAGKSEEMKELATAGIAATKAITEVNKALERLHEGPMSQADEDAIRYVEGLIAANNAESEWRDKLAATTSQMEERTASYRDLAAAVGLSYEATKQANAELAVKTFAKQKYGDAEWMTGHADDISKVRGDANDEFDAKHAEAVQSSLKKLDDQISLEQKLARVQAEGEEAVRQTTLAAKIQAIERDNDAESAKKLVQAEKDLYAAERLNAAAKNIAEINVEIDATKRLAAAQIEGAESVRRAELRLKYEKMSRAGATRQEIDATRQEDELKHQDAITEAVLKTANADRDRLQAIDQEAKAAILLEGTGADELGIMIKLRDLENERLKIIARQYLARGRAEDGVKAFFAEMQESAQTTASIIYDALNSSFGKLSENLTQLITGGKTKFGQMFKDIGREMVEASIKQGIHNGLGALGRKLGIGKKAVELTRKGQTEDTGIYVIPVGQQQPPSGSTAADATKGLANLGGQQSGGPLHGIGGVLKALGGALFGGGGGAGSGGESVISSIQYMAGGGNVSADQAYVVGDDGPEILKGTSGTILSNSASRKLVGSGGDHVYNIDARGTDPVQTEMRVRQAIIAAHGSSVTTAVRASAERARRIPA
jgi:hypothetical protein